MGWQDEIIPADFTVERQGQQVPARDHEFFKNAPDFNTFLKSAFDNHREVNARIPLPNGTSKPEDIAKWKAEHLPKLTKAGLIDAPRQLPDKYEVKRPENLPEGGWNEPLEQKVHGWAKKHGLSQDALSEAMELYQESFAGAADAFQVDRKAQAEAVKKWADSEGITVEQVDAALDRFNKDPRGWDAETAEAISKSGWADNPLVVKAIYKLMMESGTFDTRNDQGAGSDTMSADESEVLELMKVLNDPKHADYAKFNTAANQSKIDAYWKKKAGGAQYVIS